MQLLLDAAMPHIVWPPACKRLIQRSDVARLRDYLGPYQKSAFLEKYAEGLRLAGLPE